MVRLDICLYTLFCIEYIERIALTNANKTSYHMEQSLAE